MELAFSEMPLALFTTFASMGAGAFVMLAVALLAAKFDDEQLKKLDKMSFIPLVFVVVGFISAFFHLANPMNAFGVFAGIGSSPMSNEIVAGIAFVAFAVVYCVLATMGKLTEGSRKGFAAAVAMLAIVFAVLMGAAYMIDTIPSWNTALAPVQMLGFAFAGGAALGVLMLALSGAADGKLKTIALVVSVAGVVLGAGALAAQAANVAGLSNALVVGADLAGAAAMCIAVAIVALIAACICTMLAFGGKNAMVMATVALVLAFVGILAARLAFYAMQISVGLWS